MATSYWLYAKESYIHLGIVVYNRTMPATTSRRTIMLYKVVLRVYNTVVQQPDNMSALKYIYTVYIYFFFTLASEF